MLSFVRFSPSLLIFLFFFFNDTATTEIYTLSLHDALPIFPVPRPDQGQAVFADREAPVERAGAVFEHGATLVGDRGLEVRLVLFRCEDGPLDRKSTRLNSSHSQISYAVFCLKKKKNTILAVHYFISYQVTCLTVLTSYIIVSASGIFRVLIDSQLAVRPQLVARCCNCDPVRL